MVKQNTTKTLTQLESPILVSTSQQQDTDTIIVLITQQFDNFPNLLSFIRNNKIRPSSLFLPQIIKTISDTVSYNDSIVFEAIDFLDTVRLFSLLQHNNEDFFIDSIKSIIMSSRVVKDMGLTIGINQLDDFLYTSKEHLLDVIESNHILLALYIFSLVDFVSFF